MSAPFFLKEGGADDMRTGRDARPKVQVLVHAFVRIVVAEAVPVRRDREQLQPHTVERDLDLVRFGEPFDVLVAVAHQPDFDLVGTVAGNVWSTAVPPRVPNGRPSTCSSCVRSAGSTTTRLAGAGSGLADRQARHFLRRRQIAFRAASARVRPRDTLSKP